MDTLDRFRIVKLSTALQEEFDLPELVCADPEGLPFPEGNAFYRWVIDENACEPTTASNYLSAGLPFFTFLWAGSPSLCYHAPAEQIRHRVREYLKEKLGCVVRSHARGNLIVKRSKLISAISARLFLTALRRFYFCAKLKGWYTDVNPLEWATRLTMPEPSFRPRMPPQSGLTLPKEQTGRGRGRLLSFRRRSLAPLTARFHGVRSALRFLLCFCHAVFSDLLAGGQFAFQLFQERYQRGRQETQVVQAHHLQNRGI